VLLLLCKDLLRNDALLLVLLLLLLPPLLLLLFLVLLLLLLLLGSGSGHIKAATGKGAARFNTGAHKRVVLLQLLLISRRSHQSISATNAAAGACDEPLLRCQRR
jgi:hypothetical protein